MNIISDFRKDHQTLKTVSGSYEWWYFDAISDDGKHCFVIIFYEGNPFSRRYIDALGSGERSLAEDFPAISISVYSDSKPAYYGFCEYRKGDAVFPANKVYGRVANSIFTIDKSDEVLKYRLSINQKLDNGDSIEAELVFECSVKNLPSDFKSEVKGESKHVWNLVQPAADVNGKIKISGYESVDIDFQGKGYHDHNMGNEPMRDSFDDWYWGRFHFPGFTFVFYMMNKKGEQDNRAWLIDKSGESKELNGKYEINDHQLNIFGLYPARKISIEAKRMKIFIQQEKVMDNGPFYQRYFNKAVIHSEETGIEQAEGISEYIRPDRIYSKIFWPLVNMRIRYKAEKPHWVQKSPWWYRVTW